MRVAVVLVACLSCVAAIPAYLLAYNRGVGDPTRRGCRPLYPGAPIPFRCRRRGVNGISQRIRALRREPEETLTVLEIIEEDQDGTKVVEILEEDLQRGLDSPYAVSLPTKAKSKKPRCGPHQVYISELDLCEDMTIHAVEDSEVEREKKKEHPTSHPHPHHTQPIVVVKVGRFEKKKCASDQIWVPEVDLCMDINPPDPE